MKLHAHAGVGLTKIDHQQPRVPIDASVLYADTEVTYNFDVAMFSHHRGSVRVVRHMQT